VILCGAGPLRARRRRRADRDRPPEHLRRALELAETIAAFPQETLRSDRMATLARLPLADGLALEARLGRERLGAALEGARRFAGRE
jgi:enoyl-CoA hydratase